MYSQWRKKKLIRNLEFKYSNLFVNYLLLFTIPIKMNNNLKLYTKDKNFKKAFEHSLIRKKLKLAFGLLPWVAQNGH